ncbi:MAG: NADH-quinone oxidoreductase subunit M [Candidatus Electryonea clarkiae]|nr:NADH-quinone oxidoreductase subunit M [Candidatus Electryonea clarkiae]MDP8288065.1 NADH-quinone oxidoreductase subunit M [Candidatus Electryonea clarkiae]
MTLWLTAIIFIPFIGALLLLALPASNSKALRIAAFAIMTVDFIVSLPLFFAFDSSTAAFQFVEKIDWVPSMGISYHLGIDGISLLLVLLTTFLGPIVVLGSAAVTKSLRGYFISMLILQTGMLGTFLALDLFLFYVFWEVMLIPMYFLIGIWGGVERIYAAVKFFLYTMVGSLLMLVGILWIYFNTNIPGVGHSFDYTLIMQHSSFDVQAQIWLFAAFALAFAIKVPMFPFHTWLPDAHVQAPTAGSVILAGVLLKMGTYGFIRFAMPLFPDGVVYFKPLMLILAVIGIIYGAMVSIVQTDMKKLVAYSSVSHLGFVMLGLFALNTQAVTGAMIQMVNHGLSTGALFLLVGVLYDRRHTRLIADYGGVAKVMPMYATIFMIVMLSSVGVPGLNGFVGEFLILLGAYQTAPIFAILGATGVILAAVYLLWMYRRVFFGEITHEENKSLKDLNLTEWASLLPILVFIFWIGIHPNTFLTKMTASIESFLTIVAR